MTERKQRAPRLFLERDLTGAAVSLDDREAHYLGHVLRLKRGDELVAFNGRGHERDARVATLTRRSAELTLGAVLASLPESVLVITLVQALAKAEAMDLVVQKATELGVREILPVYSDHSVVKLDTERRERRVEHWNRIARSACEQSGRHTPPRIEAPAPLAAALEALPAAPQRFALEPSTAQTLIGGAIPKAGLIVAVGPEGGFGATDWRRLDAAQFARVGLGPRVLRAETAALAVCAIAQFQWGDLQS